MLFFFMSILVISCHSQPPPADINDQHIQKIIHKAHEYEKLGNIDTAIHYHKEVLKKSKRLKLPEYEVKALLNIARLLKKEDARMSLEHLNDALLIADQLNHHELRADIFLAMAEIYKQEENYKEALTALEEHHTLLDTIFSKNNEREILRIRAADARKLERTIGLIAIISVMAIAAVLAFYFRKTRNLNKQLQSSNLIKDKLFSIIGHDLRGPAGNIMEALNMVESGDLNDVEQREILAMLKKQSYAFNETLNALLNWGNTQLKGGEIHPVNFNPKNTIQMSLDVLEGQARKKNITITMSVGDHLTVLADPNHVDFVIRNLLSNAIKFSHEGGAIEISAKEQDAKVTISVTDYGSGIPEEKQKQFSSSAYMESSFGTKGEKGTGLGLMLSKEFIELSKGRIWLESKVGVGTTFYISLQKGS